jgi:hypothetical protein
LIDLRVRFSKSRISHEVRLFCLAGTLECGGKRSATPLWYAEWMIILSFWSQFVIHGPSVRQRLFEPDWLPKADVDRLRI